MGCYMFAFHPRTLLAKIVKMSVLRGQNMKKVNNGWQADDDEEVNRRRVSSVFQLKNFNLDTLLLSSSLVTDCSFKSV